jgi:hypothetical protein
MELFMYILTHACIVPKRSSVGVKRPEYKADHSPPFSAEVKNAWSYTSIPPQVYMA